MRRRIEELRREAARASDRIRLERDLEKIGRIERLQRIIGAIIRRVGGVVGGVLIPSEIDPGIPTDEEIAQMERDAREIGRIIGPEPVGPGDLPTFGVPPSTDIPQEPPAIEEVITTAEQPTEAAGPAPSTSARPSTGPLTRSVIAGVTAAVIANLLRGRGQVGQVALTSQVSDLLPSPETLPRQFLPLPQPRQRADPCEARAQRKKKQRKCLRRAGVIWAGGRRKGKSAGTRCLAFAKR